MIHLLTETAHMYGTYNASFDLRNDINYCSCLHTGHLLMHAYFLLSKSCLNLRLALQRTKTFDCLIHLMMEIIHMWVVTWMIIKSKSDLISSIITTIFLWIARNFCNMQCHYNSYTLQHLVIKYESVFKFANYGTWFTLLLAWMFALPTLSSTSSVWLKPFHAASCSAVFPFCS